MLRYYGLTRRGTVAEVRREEEKLKRRGSGRGGRRKYVLKQTRGEKEKKSFCVADEGEGLLVWGGASRAEVAEARAVGNGPGLSLAGPPHRRREISSSGGHRLGTFAQLTHSTTPRLRVILGLLPYVSVEVCYFM